MDIAIADHLTSRAVSGDDTKQAIQPTPMDRNARRIGHRGTYLGWIPVKNLRVDDTYQRGLNTKRVNAIAESFDTDAFGSILVWQRDDGTCWILDGQHRVAAVQTIYGHDSDVEVPCTIMRNLNSQDAARVFFKLNRHRLTPSSLDGFKARLAFGDDEAIIINNIVQAHGLTFKWMNGRLRFNEVGALNEIERLYRRGILGEVLSVIGEAWAGENDAHNASYLRGLHKLYSSFYDHFLGENTPVRLRTDRRRRLIDVMADFLPDEVSRRARFFQTSLNSSAGEAVARALHERFNQGLRGASRLPRWGVGDTNVSEDGDE